MENWLFNLLLGKKETEEVQLKKEAKKKKFDSWLKIKEIETEVDQWRKDMVDQIKSLDNFVLAEFLAEEDLKGKDIEDYSTLFQSYYKKVLKNREAMEKLLLSKLFDNDPDYVPMQFDEWSESASKLKRKANISVSRTDDIWELRISGEKEVLVRKIVDENERVDLIEKDLLNEMSSEVKKSDIPKVISKVAKMNGVLEDTVGKVLMKTIFEKKVGFYDKDTLMRAGKILDINSNIDKWGFNFTLFDVDDSIYNKVKGFVINKEGNKVNVFVPIPKKKPLNKLTLKEAINKLNSKDFSFKDEKYSMYYNRCIKASEDDELYKILEELKEEGDDELYNQLVSDLVQDEIIDVNERIEGEGSPTGYATMDGTGVFIEPAKKNSYK
jgi:predicted RNA-binding protein YlqC (UPF0109 family)